MAVASVITADIINSTQLPRRVYTKLVKALQSIFAHHSYEFFRGDSFQVLIKSPGDSLLLLLRARAAIMKLSAESSLPVSDIRATIAIGLVNFPVKTLRTASDDAFVLS